MGTTSMSAVFLSYNSKDSTSVCAVADALKSRGTSVSLDRWYLKPGQPVVPTLEEALQNCIGVVVFYGPFGLGPWQEREIGLAINKQNKNKDFVIVPVVLPQGSEPSGFLSAFIYTDLREDCLDADKLDVLASVFKADRADVLTTSVPSDSRQVNPYRGLLSFREEDARFFFGRDVQARKLAELVGANNFLAVVAASGSGKSSVVMAGLVPSLRKRGDWEIIRIFPTQNPWRSLAAEIVPVWQPHLPGTDMIVEISKLEKGLSQGEIRIRDVIRDIIERQRFCSRFLLVVDQWEELYTLCDNQSVRTRFIDEILDVATYKPLTVVVTLRGDFYADALQHRALADQLDQRNVNIGPMTRAELREVIEKPAALVGLSFEKGLVDVILDAVDGQDSALPILQHLLSQMWEHCDRTTLRAKTYDDLGRFEGAIAQSAEEAWKSLGDSPQATANAEALFLRLVQLNIDGTATRRRAKLSEFTKPQLDIVRRFANARILVTSRDPATTQEIVDVAHETLLSKWGRLTGLLQNQREFLLWHRRLDFACNEYFAQNHEDPEGLLKGPALAEARKWIGTRREKLTSEEQTFIDRSIESDDSAREVRRVEDKFIEQQSHADILHSCLARSETLWPSYPEKIPELEQLKNDAGKLVESLPEKSVLLAKLEERMAGAESTRVRWQCQTLSLLIKDIEALGAAGGLLAELDLRIASAKTIETRTITDRKAQWDKTIEQIKTSPKYSDLTILPQRGLIPLGVSPDSGLAEFLHFESHNGDVPVRNANGYLTIQPTTGVILVLLPGGRFHMGAQDIDKDGQNYDPKAESIEGPVHEVRLSPFFISKYLMTQGQWERLTGQNPSCYPAGTRDDGYLYTALHPVETITWAAATSVLFKTGLEIPTEAQWDYAARGGTSTVYWTGDDEGSIMRGAHLLFNRLNLKRHAPVGSYDANPFGLYDVIGNVWEFTRDRACSFSEPCREGDGLRGTEGRGLIIRGCSFFNSSAQARIAYRTEDNTPEKFESWMGVRPARRL